MDCANSPVFHGSAAFSPASRTGYITTMPQQRTRHKNIEIQCLSITKTKNQTQRTFPTRLAVPPQANLAMASDTASPALLHVSPATTLTNETNDRHQHDLPHSPDTKVRKASSSNLKHDDGHIHRASPIRGLPPEHSKPVNIGFGPQDELHTLTTGPTQTMEGLSENQASNSALTWPAEFTGDRGIDGRNRGHPHKVFPPQRTSCGYASVR